MLIPVGAPGFSDGILMLGRDAGSDPFDSEAVELISTFAASASAAVRLDDARRASRKAELLEDRDRIGRDMHDKVIGRLFATGMSLQSMLGRISDSDAHTRLSAAVDEIDDSIKEIRDTIYGLRSRVEWGKGARGEILSIAAEQKAGLGFEPRVSLHGSIDDLDPALVEGLLATLRESLTNAAKYANATRVTVDVNVEMGTLRLTVVDNGDGFDPDENSTPSGDLTGNGLTNIATRAERLNGHAIVTSTPGVGTNLELAVPLI